MTLRISSILAASMVLWAGITLAGCECIDCNRAGPIVGYIRTLVQDESGSPVSGASVHLDNRSLITEPQTTETDGTAVLLVYMDTEPTDTGTITVFPPTAYQPPAPRPVITSAGDTINVSFALLRN
jgi:hypothetical protein